jgi:hypothetical protein
MEGEIMRNRFVAAATFGILLSAAAMSRADMIQWSYDWSKSTNTAIGKDGTGGAGGGVAFTSLSGAVSGNSTIVASNLSTFSAASVGIPDTLSGVPYHMVLDLTDKASGQQGVLTFNGLLSGSLSAKGANITNQFLSPLTQDLQLGGHDYRVSIGPYSAPGPPDSVNRGAISASVAIDPTSGTGGGGGNPPPVDKSPEPASFLLAAAALPALALLRARRRRA